MNLLKNKSISLSRVLHQVGVENVSKAELEVFINDYKEQIGELWHRFRNNISQEEQDAANDLSCEERQDEDRIKTELYEQQIANAQVNQLYKTSVVLPDKDIETVEIIGSEHFNDLNFDVHSGMIQGMPLKEGDAEVTLEYLVKKQVKFKMYINDDPRNLWQDIPSGQENKPDNECDFSNHNGLNIISASRRGRSHAQKGTPRDDHFMNDTFDDWIIAVVADGVGRANQSNLGSKVACEAIVKEIKKGLEITDDKLLHLIQNDDVGNSSEGDIKEFLYEVLVKAAYKAFVAMNNTAKEKELSISDLSTTLSVIILKQMENSRFVAAFQVGDGIIASYSPDKVELLCKIDRGEYKGQTLALNSQDVFVSRDSLLERLHFTHIPDDAVIVLMTDGIIDPYFDNDDEKLKNVEEWTRLWDELENEALVKDKPEEKLLAWLNFYKEAEHDDRTITIIK